MSQPLKDVNRCLQSRGVCAPWQEQRIELPAKESEVRFSEAGPSQMSTQIWRHSPAAGIFLLKTGDGSNDR